MKDLSTLDKYRNTEGEIIRYGQSMTTISYCGVFFVECPDEPGLWLRVIADAGGGWDHVSISTVKRCPTWAEMDYLKRMFFKDNETAMQLHVPPDDHINTHPFCLHLWRPRAKKIPMPPKDRV